MSDKESTGSQESGPEKRSNLKVQVLSKHEYDIDFIDLYEKIEKLTQPPRKSLRPSLDRPKYLQMIKEMIQGHCQAHGIDPKEVFRTRHLMISALDELYGFCLALEVITRDLPKLHAFLAFQQANYQNDHEFLNVLEFRVYDLIATHSPLTKNQSRLNWLMNWVDEQRTKLNNVSVVKTLPEEASSTASGPGSKKAAGESRGKSNNRSQVNIKVTMEEAIISKDNFEKMLLVLKSLGILSEDGKWKGRTKYKSEILALIEILKEKGYIRPLDQTKLAGCICEYFGVQLSDRGLRSFSQTCVNQILFYRKNIPDSAVIAKLKVKGNIASGHRQ